MNLRAVPLQAEVRKDTRIEPTVGIFLAYLPKHHYESRLPWPQVILSCFSFCVVGFIHL